MWRKFADRSKNTMGELLVPLSKNRIRGNYKSFWANFYGEALLEDLCMFVSCDDGL